MASSSRDNGKEAQHPGFESIEDEEHADFSFGPEHEFSPKQGAKASRSASSAAPSVLGKSNEGAREVDLEMQPLTGADEPPQVQVERPKKRLYNVWPSRNKFFCKGTMMTGGETEMGITPNCSVPNLCVWTCILAPCSLYFIWVMQMLAWPWKVPLLNVTDCIISFCIVLTVTTSTLYLNQIESAMYGFASGVSTAMLSGIFAAISIMVCMTVSALIYRSAMGGQKELKMFTLGSVPNPEELSKKVKEMAMVLEKSDTGDIASKLAALSVFDTQKITTCVTLLATEVAPPLEDARSFKFNKRIASSSFDPALKRKPQSLRLTRETKKAEQPVESNEIVETTPAEQQAENVKKDAQMSTWI